MADYTPFAQFNTFSVTGRIANVDLVETKDGQFISVSLYSTVHVDKKSKEAETIEVKFTTSGGLMSLYSQGHFCKGREVTLTGHIVGVRQVYKKTNKETGEITTHMLQRPQIQMQGVQVLEGSLGRKPASEKASDAGTVVQPVAARWPPTPCITGGFFSYSLLNSTMILLDYILVAITVTFITAYIVYGLTREEWYITLRYG